MDWTPLISFLTHQFCKTTSSHTFVSFNYDLVLERGIQIAANGNVDLTRMYGFSINTQVTADPQPLGTGAPFSLIDVMELSTRAMDLELSVLKPHGSLNWFGPTKEHYDKSHNDDLRQGRSVVLPLGSDGALRYLKQTNQSLVRLSNGLIIDVEPLIVTPRGAKKADRPFLRETRDKEEAAILDAEEVYVLGWSVPRTDSDQECMIRTTIGKRAKSIRELTVVNLHENAGYYARVQQIFGVEQSAVRTYNSGFKEFVKSRLSH